MLVLVRYLVVILNGALGISEHPVLLAVIRLYWVAMAVTGFKQNGDGNLDKC
ncbi:hypothetical protein LOJ96_00130 [Escherichia coli]|nr:hypothetical protein [Escherichia coli]MCC9274765.1 hypothetical protein [Escherichia coli]